MSKMKIKDLSVIENLLDEQNINVCGGMGSTQEITFETDDTPGGSTPSVNPTPRPPKPPKDELPGLHSQVIDFTL